MGETEPKLFISYSWSTPDHMEWVLSLATGLRENGVDVILDKWDLKEGQDAYAFMEQMVNNPDIKKVALICDRSYKDKADSRSKGVGAEAQIISPEIYAKQDQTKFVAVVAELDSDGKPYLPAYCEGRIYIDMSDSESYASNFEQLLRWVYDRPFHPKPPLGKMPEYLKEGAISSLGTASRFRHALGAVRDGKSYCDGAVGEYFDTLRDNLERFRISEGANGEFDDKVVTNIEEFLPYRNEAIELFIALARYRGTPEVWSLLHRFFESLIPYLHPTQNVKDSLDNFRFIIHELFLYAIASLLKHEHFDGVAHLLRQQYYVPPTITHDEGRLVPFCVFYNSLSSLEHRNKRLNLRRASLWADLLKDRCGGSRLDFRELMQADFVLYIRICMDILRLGGWRQWWPETLIYAGDDGPFEIFARGQSKRYFQRIGAIFDVEEKDDLTPLAEAFNTRRLVSPQWGYYQVNAFKLMGLSKLATLP